MKWLKYTLIFFGGLIAVLAALSFFISFNNYIPQIEKELSSKIKEPVSIKNIQFRFLPAPHFNVYEVKVGVDDDLKLAKVVLTPDVFLLLKSSYVIKEMEIDGLILNQNAIDKLLKLTKVSTTSSSSQTIPRLRVNTVSFTNSQLKLDKVSFGPFNATVDLSNNSQLLEATLTTVDGKFHALIKPEQSNYSIDVSAQNWTLPIKQKILLDKLSVKALATTNDINFTSVNVKLYGGTANGNALLSWQKGLKVNGHFDVKQVEMEKIAKTLSPKTHVSGQLTAKPVFSASANSADLLMKAVHLETSFDVQKGVLYGVDVESAATNLIKQGKVGGKTNFDHLSGQLLMSHGRYSFTQLKIASGTLSVEGNVNISHQKELSGRIHAQVNVAGVSTKVPLNVAGTIDSPRLYPTTATIAGAAVGTAIMGPGVGTSVGAKVGDWVDDLFSKKKK